jgi:hypothetical protein
MALSITIKHLPFYTFISPTILTPLFSMYYALRVSAHITPSSGASHYPPYPLQGFSKTHQQCFVRVIF